MTQGPTRLHQRYRMKTLITPLMVYNRYSPTVVMDVDADDAI